MRTFDFWRFTSISPVGALSSLKNRISCSVMHGISQIISRVFSWNLYRDPHNQGFHQHPTPSPGTCSTFLLLLTIHRQHGQAGTKMSTHRSSGASRSSLFLPAAPSLLSLHRIRGAGACVRKKNKRKCMPQGRKWKKGKSKRGREKEADLDGDQSSGAWHRCPWHLLTHGRAEATWGSNPHVPYRQSL